MSLSLSNVKKKNPVYALYALLLCSWFYFLRLRERIRICMSGIIVTVIYICVFAGRQKIKLDIRLQHGQQAQYKAQCIFHCRTL